MKIFRGVIFIVLVVVVFCLLQRIVVQKSGSSAAIREFYSNPHEIDVVAVGPSYVFCTYNTIEAYRLAGLSSYLPCTPCQPIEVSYYFLKEALKFYRPQVAILGATMFVFRKSPYVCSDAFLHMATDNMPMGMDKIKMLRGCALTEGIETYLIPLMKYHSRWRGIGNVDYDMRFFSRTHFEGYSLNDKVFASNGFKLVDLRGVVDEPVCPESLVWLDRFAALAKEYDCPLVLLLAPRHDSDRCRLGRYVTLFQKAENLGIPVLNLNDSSFVDSDFSDMDHLNVNGSEKATRRIVKFLQEHYGLKPSMTRREQERWEEMSRRYDEQKSRVLRKSGRKK